MAMDECPHCGEPIDEEATFCRHCGSDGETGWKPDTDYYAVELPEDEDAEAEPSEAPPRWMLKERLRSLLGPALVTAAWVGFVAYGFSRFRPPVLVLVPAIYLGLAIAVVARLAQRQAS